MDYKQIRTDLKMSQREFAKILGIDAPTLSKIENGKILPTPAMDNIVFKAFASSNNARNGGGSINYPTSEEKSLKTEISTLVLEALENSSIENPVSRASLRMYCKSSDRNIRKAIQELRKSGYRIGATSNGAGYWMCKSSEEYQIIRNEYMTRVIDMMGTIQAMDKSLPGQVEIGTIYGSDE